MRSTIGAKGSYRCRARTNLKHYNMANTRLFLDTRTLDRTGCGTLRLALYHQNTSTTTSLGIHLKPSQWDGAQVVNHPEKKNLDLILQKRKSNVDMILFRMETDGESLPRTAKELMTKVNSVLYPDRYAPKKLTFTDIFYKVIAKKDGNTKRSYLCALKKMQDFDPHLEDRTFEELNVDWFEDFISFMGKTMTWNGERNYLRNIRTVFNYARDEGITTNYPFRKLDMSAAPTKKRCLSLEQLQTLRTMSLEPWQEEYRDMFMLMFYLIGINAVDLFTAKADQLVNGRLEYVRTKTRNSSKEQYSVKVEPEAMALIEKYRGEKYLLSPCDRYASYADYLHHMNKALGSFGKSYKSGVGYSGRAAFPNLTSYWARHSWSTLAYELGFSVDIIGQGLGHADSKHAVTMIYIKPDQRKVDEANRKVIDAVTQ